jgi:DNA invertase Pin-like site-specific DNA recombinase
MVNRTLGYARVSTAGQSLDAQVDQLTRAGCQRVFSDTASGAKAVRPGLDALLDHVREGDEVVAVKLDRFGRSIAGIHTLLDDLSSRGVLVRTLDGLTTDPGQLGGKVLIAVMAAVAEVERDLIRERTMQGLAAARERGRVGGRRRSLTRSQEKSIIALIESGQSSARAAAEDFGVSRATVYRVLERARAK